MSKNKKRRSGASLEGVGVGGGYMNYIKWTVEKRCGISVIF
jgi:hypothetical protein